MAKKFLTPINVTNLSSDPGSAIDGDIYYNTVSDNLKLYANGAWTSVSASGGAGVTSITGTSNEIDVSASTGAVTLSLPSTIARQSWVTSQGYLTQSSASSYYQPLNQNLTGISNASLTEPGFLYHNYIQSGINWTTRNVGSIGRISASRYGNGLWAIGTINGELRTSTDTITWVTRNPNITGWVNEIGYGNGLWIAAGDDGTLSTSTDTISWVTRTSNAPLYSYINGVAYGNGIWVIGGYSTEEPGFIRTSTDAISWVTRVSAATTQINRIEYGNGRWISVGYSGEITTSTDSINWTTSLSLMDDFLTSVSYGNNLWIITGYNNSPPFDGFQLSTNGISWTTTITAYPYSDIAYGNGAWFAVGQNGRISTSTNGINWTSVISNFGFNQIHEIAYGNGNWIIGGRNNSNGQLNSSFEINNWTFNNPQYAPLNSPAFTGIPAAPTASVDTNTTQIATTEYVIGQGYLKSEIAGSTYLTQSSASSTYLTQINAAIEYLSLSNASVTYLSQANASSTYLTQNDASSTYLNQSSASSTYLTQNDASSTYLTQNDASSTYLTQSSASSTYLTQNSASSTYLTQLNAFSSYQPLNNNLNDISNAPLIENGLLYVDSIPDGVTWTSTNVSVTGLVSSLEYGNNIWVATANKILLTSTNAITWVTQNSNFGNKGIRTTAYGNGLWVISGEQATIATSTDTIFWTTRESNFPSDAYIEGLSYGNGLWVAGCYSLIEQGAIRTSTDGISWSTVSSAATQGINAISYGNGRWVSAGYYGDITTSTNGINWTTSTSLLDGYLSSVSYANNIWLISGYNMSSSGGIQLSTNGISWTTIIPVTEIRDIAYGNNSWIAGGQTAKLYTSTNAITWTTLNSNFYLNSINEVAYGNGNWVIGGGNNNIAKINVSLMKNGWTSNNTKYALLNSPSFTGTPIAPTASVDTNTTQIATTAYVIGQNYLKSDTASAIYLTQSSASSNYLTQSSASSTYLTQSSASSTYLTQASANSIYAPLASPTFTGVVTVPSPSNPTDAATKSYVDAVAEGLHIHASVQTATTASIDLSTPPASIDGVTLINNMRILVKNQTTQSENGVYVYNSASASLTRASDFDTSAEIHGGDFIFITGGNTYDNTGWVQTEIITTVGSDPIIFQQFSGAGTYSAGTGLALDGTVFSNTGVLSLAGTTNEINVSASSGNITLSIPSAIARLASPTFTGTPAAPTAAADTNTTQIATTEFVINQGYLKSATASSTYATLASPALTGIPTAPTASVDTNTTQIATTAYVIGQEYLKSATASSTYLTQSSASSTYAPLASPIFTGTVTLPTGTTQIGNTSLAQGVTGTITLPSTAGTLSLNTFTTTGDIKYSSSGSTEARLGIGTVGQALVVNSGATAPEWKTLTLENMPGAFVKKAVRVATTTNITLSGGAPNIVDGITLAANDRILVKNQTTTSENGIYYVQTLGTGSDGTWTRTIDGNLADEIAGALLSIDEGTMQAGGLWKTTFKATDILGSSPMLWYRMATDDVIINTQTSSYTLSITDSGEIVETNVATANNITIPPNSSVPFPIGTTIDIVQYGSGQTTIVAGSGVTVRSSGNKLKLTGQYSAATLYKRGADEWVAMGDLSS